MKAVLILSVLFVLFQAGRCDLLTEMSEAVTECSTQQKLDKKTFASLQNELSIPEDNHEAGEFYVCTSKKVGTMDGNGDVVEARMKEVLVVILTKELGDIPDATGKAQHIINEAVENCKDTPKGNTAGQSAIKLRNCLKGQVQKTRPLNM